jgi:hypothetical protein
MSLASDLMGLGVSPLLAARTAQGGIGPLTITAAGSSFATATRIQCQQYLASCSNADGTVALSLPVVGTDNGALLADDFVINNAGTTSLRVFLSSGVTISIGGVNTSFCTIALHTSMTCYPITTTQWIGVKGS